jgi:hypothetical protein
VEITLEEEAQLHTLSDAELAAIIAIVEAAEDGDFACQENEAPKKTVKLECIELFGSYTVVQKLRTRIRHYKSKNTPLR